MRAVSDRALDVQPPSDGLPRLVHRALAPVGLRTSDLVVHLGGRGARAAQHAALGMTWTRRWKLAPPGSEGAPAH